MNIKITKSDIKFPRKSPFLPTYWIRYGGISTPVPRPLAERGIELGTWKLKDEETMELEYITK